MTETNANSGAVGSGAPTSSETILQEAERLINGDRQEQYGNACESLERIADMWNAYIFTTSEPPQSLTAMDVANMMVLLKVSRSKTSLDRSEFHRDSHVDMAGYAGLGGRAWDEIQESVKPRQWVCIRDVPSGVRVTDKDGDVFVWEYGNLMFRGFPWGVISSTFDENLSPFTEVLDRDE